MPIRKAQTGPKSSKMSAPPTEEPQDNAPPTTPQQEPVLDDWEQWEQITRRSYRGLGLTDPIRNVEVRTYILYHIWGSFLTRFILH